MIERFVNAYMLNQHQLKFAKGDQYCDIVRKTLELADVGNEMDLDNIHSIDDGDYQGTLLFLIPEKRYQPSTYWCVFVDYGSCSICDTVQAIADDSETPDKDAQTLGLHIVQQLKEI